MNFFQELGVVEAILGDVAAFASGQPVSANVPNTKYTASVVILPNGPVAPYQTLSGSFFSILEVAFTDAAAFAAGAPLQIAVKENKSWYGISLSQPAPISPAVA